MISRNSVFKEITKKIVYSWLIYDKVTGLTSAQAISAALYQKAIGEGGQYLPISMMESALYYNWPDLMMNYTIKKR